MRFYKVQCLATRFTEPDNELFIPQSKQYRSVSEQSITTSQGMHIVYKYYRKKYYSTIHVVYDVMHH